MMVFSLGRLQATMQMSTLDWFAEERDLIFRWLKSLAFFQQTPGIDVRAIAKHMQVGALPRGLALEGGIH